MFDVTRYGHKDTRFPHLVTKRFRMFVGPYCNEDCKFCYYKGYLHNRELSCSTDFFFIGIIGPLRIIADKLLVPFIVAEFTILIAVRAYEHSEPFSY